MLKKEVVILIAEDDVGHATLINKNLERAGITNTIIHFRNGEKTLDFLFKKGEGPHCESGIPYVLLLDIRMPGIDGIEVLRQIKGDERLKKMPVIMITTTDDPRVIEESHNLGCNHYIVKPVDYESFFSAVRQLGLFLQVVEIPHIDDEKKQ